MFTMSENESDSQTSSSIGEEKLDHRIKVYLRLRPMNKLEASRRSKHCVEIHNDDDGPPTEMTVDSPLEGEFDFSFDRVFGETTSQSYLFQNTISPMAAQLLEGYNCTVLAYGQTGSGKTHTMMGCGGGIGSADNKKKEERSGSDKASEISSDGGEVDAVDVDLGDIEGMIPRTVRSIFALMEKSPPTIEYTIRCSYVEIHLERILDLLNPGGVGDVPLNIMDDAPGDEAAGIGENDVGVRIVGASEVYCVDETDVLALLTRGNACRSASNAKVNTDSSRSHAVFVLKVEQQDVTTGETKKSVLNMLDLAGSEMASKKQAQQARSQQNSNTGQTEVKMINKALTALNNLVRAQAKSQRNGGDNKALVAASRQAKLTRLLRPSFGGNCITTVVLTGSPSSYNIGETISTIRFGQFCKHIRNSPATNAEFSSEIYRKRLAESEKEQAKLKTLIKELATECNVLKTESRDSATDARKHTGPLWKTIDEILKQSDEGDNDEVSPVEIRQSSRRNLDGTGSPALELERLKLEIDEVREELKRSNEALHKSENALAEAQSEVAVLRTQNDGLAADSKKFVQDLIDAKNEAQLLSQRKIEVEHNLRTSQFRENEATTFLRQFRRFYHRLLKNKAAQGSGNTQEITKKTPGVPQLQDLIDIDKLLLESGLIEEDELQDEKSTMAAYRPSKEALLRSTHAAKNAAASASSLAASSASASSYLSTSETSGEDGSSYVTSSSVNTSVKQMGVLDISSGNQALDSISEMGDGGVSQYARSLKSSVVNEEMDALSKVGRADDLDNIGERKSVEGYDASGKPHGEADAGAGASADPSVPVHEGENWNSKSIRVGKGTYAGAVTAARQKALGTPAGRLIAIQEKELEWDLKDLTQRCIELQIALNEEQANVDALTNRSGSATLSKKRLAQEAIQLRQQVDRKTHDLQAIIWKMNELHLINKTYNDKMASREQHVAYLEENLVDLQNTNRRLVKERQMAEKKLRDELDHLKSLVDGMTVPLWQFGERREKGRMLASRIVLPVVGSRSMLDIEADLALDSSGEDEDQDSSSSVESAVKQRGVVDAKAASANKVARGISEGGDDVKTEKELMDASTQTDEAPPVETAEIGLQANMDPEIQKEDLVTQTDAVPLVASQTQTEDIPSAHVSTMTDEALVEKAVTTEMAIQTDPVNLSQQPSTEARATSEIAIQTESIDDSDRAGLKLAAAGAAGTGAGLALGANKAVPAAESKGIPVEGEPADVFDAIGSSELQYSGEDMGANEEVSRSPEQDTGHEVDESRRLDPTGSGTAIVQKVEDETGAPSADIAAGAPAAVNALGNVAEDETLQDLSESGENIPSRESNALNPANETDEIEQLPESKLPPDFFLGGKSADFVPRRFAKKFGPKINPGVIVKESKPSSDNKKKKDHTDSSRSKKKKKKKSSRSEQKDKKKKSSRSASRKRSDDKTRGGRSSKH